MDEADLLLLNKFGYVVTKEGSKGVYKLKSKEKVENIMAMVYCNAEGNFLSLPVCIFKEVNKKIDLEDKMSLADVEKRIVLKNKHFL